MYETDGKKCFNIIKQGNSPCNKNSCRYFLKSDNIKNCSVLSAMDGPKTLKEFEDVTDYTLMGICQIEKRAIQKLKKILKNIEK